MHHNALHHASGTAEGRARSEPELRQLIVQALRASGIAVEEQVVCQAGAADIVTVRRDAVIEVKLELTRKAIQWAVGQVLLYREAINPAARAIVVGYATGETAGLMEWTAAIGVEVICWNADGGKLKSELSALSVPSFSLQWNVQALAHSHGVTRVADLARFLGLPRAGLYGVWRGTAVNISVARLERFAQRLGSTSEEWLRPGGWFRWDNRRRLVWAVRDAAEQVGLDASQLAFAANQYPQQLELFWTGEAKFVFVETLAQLAAALERDDRVFDVGEVFVRVEG
jgi:DNA-binding Xre family transcriptional regulator